MSRIFLFAIILTFSCTLEDREATAAVHLEMANALQINNKRLITINQNELDRLRDQVMKKVYFRKIAWFAERIYIVNLDYLKYLDQIDRQLFMATGYEKSKADRDLTIEELKKRYQIRSQPKNFNQLPLEVLKNKALARQFFNEIPENSTQTIHKTIMDSTLAVQGRLRTLLTSLSNNQEIGIYPQEIEELMPKALYFAIDSMQSNGKTRLQNAFEEKSVAGCHAALILLKNEALNGAGEILDYLNSKTYVVTTGGGRPVIVSSPSKHRFKAGSIFETSIFIASPMQYPDVRIAVNGDSIPVKGGVGIYKTRMPQSGKLTYEAKISALNPFTGKRNELERTFVYD